MKITSPANPRLSILHLEDNDYDAELVRRTLQNDGIEVEVTRVMKRETFVDALEHGAFDLILSDYSMPGFDGGRALAIAREKCPATPFVFVSGTIGEEAAVQSLKKGAANYVLKNRLDQLAQAIRTTLHEADARQNAQQSLQALRQRADLFQQISETVTDLVCVLDLHGRRLYTSHSYQALFGPEPLHGTDAFEDIHPDDRQRIRQIFHMTIETGVGQDAEFRFLLKDGSIRYIESHGGVIRDVEGKVSNVIVVSRDVTKRKCAEENLKVSEDRFRSVIQTANDAIVLADATGSIVAWNSAAQRMFGYSESEVHGKPLISLLAERYRSGREAGLGVLPGEHDSGAPGVSGFIALAVELHGLRKDATEFPLELSLSTWKKDARSFYSAIFRDITERQRTRQALEQLRRQNQLLLNCAGEGILGLDRQGQITIANPAAAKMLGYGTEELIGSSFYSLMQPCPADQRSLVQFPLDPTLSEGVVRRVADQVFWRKDRTHFSVEYVSTPIQEKEECIGAVIVFRDITERKQVAEQLRNQAALIEHATDAICVINMEAKIIYWNKSAETLYGWSASQAFGKPAHDLLFRARPEQGNEAFRILIQKYEWEGEMHQLTKAGKEIVVQSRWTLMHDSQGAAKSILVINSDITERKKLEAQFLRAQRLESVGRLAGGIAHDLNNVLAPILLCAEMLSPKLKGSEDKKLIETIEASARRGGEMVTQILSLSRGGDRKVGRVQVKTLIDEQIKVARQTFPPSIEIRAHVPKNAWAITGNATQLFQLLMNLCVNARDAMPEGGTLMIEVENVVVDHEYVRLHPKARPGPHVALAVTDSGTGIPPQIVEKIFRSGFTTKPLGKGTGLGLATVQTIVENHHGHLQVHSEIGKGTTFKIFLPVAEENQSLSEIRQSADVPQGHGEWILVVDDEETIREIMASTLEHFGYRVLAASDGTEAIARYAKYKDRIALVVADMVMPFMDGSALIHALRRMNPNVKILGISGRIEEKHPANPAEQMGIIMLPKPVSSEKLLMNIHRLLASCRTGR